MDITGLIKYLTYYDKIISPSVAVKNQIESAVPKLNDKCYALNNFIDAKKIIELSKEKCTINVNNNLCNIITVARNDNFVKKIDRIPLITNKLIKLGISNFHWYIVGDGPDLENNKKLSKELKTDNYITFCGKLENPFSLLRSCDFFVLTSKSESYGNVIIESFILGKPVIAAKYDALYEIIKDNENGLIAEQNIDDMTEKIKKMIVNENNIKTNLINNLKNYKYDNNVIYNNLIGIIKK